MSRRLRELALAAVPVEAAAAIKSEIGVLEPEVKRLVEAIAKGAYFDSVQG